MSALMLVGLFLGGLDNMLVNADLTAGTDGWIVDERITSATIDPLADGPALRLDVAHDQEPTWFHITQGFPVTPGEIFEGEVLARAGEIRNGHGLLVTIGMYDADEKRIAHDDAYMPAGLSGDAWSGLHVVLRAPEDAKIVRFGVLLHGTGTGWFRDPVFRKLPPPLADPAEGPVMLGLTGTELLNPVTGFGAEDDGWFFNSDNAGRGADADAIALREGRIGYVEPDHVRMFFWYMDWNPSGDFETFTWDSENMESHYRTLDLYQQMGARVNVAGVEWAVDDPFGRPEAMARAIGALLEHLVKDKGYTCIRDWTLTNEPNLFFATKGYTFDRFAEIHKLVKAEFERRGLDLNIVGSDDGDGYSWFERCATDPAYHDLCGLMASHFYFYIDNLDFAHRQFEKRLELLRKARPDAPLPFIVAEFGLRDERTAPPDINPLMQEYPYALQSARLFIEGLGLGVTGFSMWCMHEMYYPGAATPMRFGMWDFGDENGEWKIRPVYHAVSLFARNTDPGDRIETVQSSHPASFKAVKAGDRLFWVNLSDTGREVVAAGFGKGSARILTDDETLSSDREAGSRVTLDGEGRFMALPMSFGCVAPEGMEVR